jgi:hypothetical protein
LALHGVLERTASQDRWDILRYEAASQLYAKDLMRIRTTFQSRISPWFLALGACGAATQPPAVPTLRDVSLTQAFEHSSLRKVAEPDSAVITKLVLDPQSDEDLNAIFRTFEQWCDQNAGSVVQSPKATDCSPERLPGAGCLAEASWWYASKQGELRFAPSACIGAESHLLAALIAQNHADKQDQVVAVLEGAALTTFLDRYIALSQATQRKWQESKDEAEAKRVRAFDEAVAQLDANQDSALRGAPTARMSVDFIREKVGDSGYQTSLEFTSPCVITTRSQESNLADVELRSIDLNVLAGIAERTIELRGRVFNTYRLFLKVGPRTSYLDYNASDAAQRSAKAFDSLARRCGNKPDVRFK